MLGESNPTDTKDLQLPAPRCPWPQIQLAHTMVVYSSLSPVTAGNAGPFQFLNATSGAAMQNAHIWMQVQPT